MTTNTPGTGNANDPGATEESEAKPDEATMQDAQNYFEKTGAKEATPEEINADAVSGDEDDDNDLGLSDNDELTTGEAAQPSD